MQAALDAWVGGLRRGSDGPRIRARRDLVGNLIVSAGAAPRLLITAHLDHPAFVVRRATGPRELELEFRGGVHDPYFDGAAIEVFGGTATTGAESDAAPLAARIVALDSKAKPFKRVRAMLIEKRADARRVEAGSIARWKLAPARIAGGVLHTHACDDLAAVAIAMITFERLLARGTRAAEDVGLLFTVAEEVGFLGAIHAATSGLVPKGARLLCLENSRSFPSDSPIGAGAILRVGDRLSVFSPGVTNALTQLYQQHAAKTPGFRWQRKLMPGGACEATAFAALGHASTCLCLPLGNYHNMRDIDGVLAGKRPARVGHEFVAIADVESLVEMLLLAARAHGDGRLAERDGAARGAGLRGARAQGRSAKAGAVAAPLGDLRPMIDRLWRERSKDVLGVTRRP